MKAKVNTDTLTVRITTDGTRGRAGLQVELKGEDGKIFHRYEGETVWKELIDVNDALQVITREQIIGLIGYEPANLVHVHANATGTLDGFMSKEDKSKLDSISKTVIDGKFDKPQGNTGQFIDGAGGLQEFPQMPEPKPQVNADWQATDGEARILNKPILGSAALTNTDRYATAAEGQLAVTAVQPAALDSKLDVPNGTASQFVNGLGELSDFSDFSQVNADWQATEGAAFIRNKPALGSAAFSANTSFAANVHVHVPASAATNGLMSFADKIKLDTVAENATENQPDAFLINRANHTGSLPMTAVTGLPVALNSKLNAPNGTALDYIDGTGAARPFPHGEPIYILASGQSNMALIVNEPTANFEYSDRVHYWNFRGWENEYGTEFVPLVNTESSTAMQFANEVAAANPLSEVYVVNVSFGGTSITSWTENTPIAGGTTINGNIDRAIAQLATLGLTNVKFDYFLWWQGEADAHLDNQSWYRGQFELLLQMLNARADFDRWDIRYVIFGIGDAPRIAWPTYSTMNYALQNIVNSLGGSASFVNTGSIPVEFWQTPEDVHLTAEGYAIAGKRGFIASSGGGEIGTQYMKDNLIQEMPEVLGYGLILPDREIEFNPRPLVNGTSALYMYKESYLSETIAIAGLTETGTASYSRRQGQILRVGSQVTFAINMVWTGHTGTGQLAFTGMPFDNLMGTDMPVTCHVEGFGATGPVVALWQTWFKDIHFFRYNPAGELVPLEIVPNGTIALTGTFMRLRQD